MELIFFSGKTDGVFHGRHDPARGLHSSHDIHRGNGSHNSPCQAIQGKGGSGCGDFGGRSSNTTRSGHNQGGNNHSIDSRVILTAVKIRGVVARKILKGQPFSNNDVIKAMTSLLQLALQNIGGGAAATPATPATTPLITMEHPFC